MEYKRLKEIRSYEEPTIKDVIEITSENFLSASQHSKDIKNLLANISDQLVELNNRLASLEAKNSNIFQLEMNDDSEDDSDDELSLEEEINLSDVD